MALVLVAPFLFAPLVASADINGQIHELEGQVNSTTGQLNSTKQQANTLQGQVNALNAQIADLQGKIASTQAQIDQTQARIDATEADLAAKKKLLGELIKANYENGKTSTLEVLASSSSISEFFTQQQYILSVKDRIDQMVTEVMAIRKQLDDQKTSLTAQQKDLQGQESLVGQAQANQQQLLDATQGQEANYQSMLNGQLSQLSGLYALRAAAHAQSGGSGGYPAIWANAPQDSMVDDWYYYNRECVSFVAWKRAMEGRPTSGYGNAAQWPVNSSTPTVGSVAVWGYSIGAYGHVAYVEAVYADGSIMVSQYNWGLRGEFSTMTISPGSSYWPSKGFLN